MLAFRGFRGQRLLRPPRGPPINNCSLSGTLRNVHSEEDKRGAACTARHVGCHEEVREQRESARTAAVNPHNKDSLSRVGTRLSIGTVPHAIHFALKQSGRENVPGDIIRGILFGWNRCSCARLIGNRKIRATLNFRPLYPTDKESLTFDRSDFNPSSILPSSDGEHFQS